MLESTYYKYGDSTQGVLNDGTEILEEFEVLFIPWDLRKFLKTYIDR